LELGRKMVGFDEKKLQIVIKVKITIVRPMIPSDFAKI